MLKCCINSLERFVTSVASSRTAASGAAVLSLALLAICGCQNMAEAEGEPAAQSVAASASAPDVHVDAVSVVGGHYFPTDDGEEDTFVDDNENCECQ